MFWPIVHENKIMKATSVTASTPFIFYGTKKRNVQLISDKLSIEVSLY